MGWTNAYVTLTRSASEAVVPCQISSDGLTRRVPLLACPAVSVSSRGKALLDKPAVAPFSSLVATRQSKFNKTLVAEASSLQHRILNQLILWFCPLFAKRLRSTFSLAVRDP